MRMTSSTISGLAPRASSDLRSWTQGTRGASTAGSEAALVARVPRSPACLPPLVLSCAASVCVSLTMLTSPPLSSRNRTNAAHTHTQSRSRPRVSPAVLLLAKLGSRWTARGGSYEWAWRSERAGGRGSDEHSSNDEVRRTSCGMRENQQARHRSKPPC